MPVIFRVRHTGRLAGIATMHQPASLLDPKRIGAVMLATKFANDWRRRVMKAVIAGSDTPANDAAKALGSRLDSIAVTETSRSFNDVRQELSARISLATDELLVKRWDAQLDACEFCAHEHGTVVLASQDFPGGIPGYVHPRCQCVTHYMRMSRFEFYAMQA